MGCTDDLLQEILGMKKYRNFYYTITPRGAPHNDFLLHIKSDMSGWSLCNKPFDTEEEAEQHVETWTATVHKTVREYHRL